MLMSALGFTVFGIIRVGAGELYPATIFIRIYFLVWLTVFYRMTSDPLFLVSGAEVLPKAKEIAGGIARMRTKSIKAIMGAMHVPYRLGLAEGTATEHENYMEMYDPKTFVAAVTALFEQRTIEFTD
jgi:hypothetical protein